jgi:hypothetical protein
MLVSRPRSCWPLPVSAFFGNWVLKLKRQVPSTAAQPAGQDIVRSLAIGLSILGALRGRLLLTAKVLTAKGVHGA